MAGVFTPAYGRLSAGTSRRPTRTIPGRGAPTTSALVAHVSTPLVANHRSDRPASPRVDDRAARRRGDLGSFRAAIRWAPPPPPRQADQRLGRERPCQRRSIHTWRRWA